MRNFFLLILLLAITALNLFADETAEFQQNIEVEEAENLNPVVEKKLIIKQKIPMKAAVLSLIFPGGGQFYNGSYLKSSIVMGLELSVIGLAVYHHNESKQYYDKYLQTQNEVYYSKYVDYYNKRQSDLWWVGTVIFLSAIDAFVDAHLHDYDETKKKIRLKFEENMLSLEYRF